MSGEAAGSRLPRATLAGLASLLAFEPRRPSFAVAGLQLTLLELAAGLAALLLAWSLRREIAGLLRVPPPALTALAAFALAHVAAAALAPANRGASLVFSLRMLSAAVFAVLVAASGARGVRCALSGLAAGAGIVAVLACLERMEFQALDAFLDLFRMSPFFVAGARRASATTENPNLAAALLAQGLVAGVGLLGWESRRVRVVGLAGLLSAGLVLTYSRGGLMAAAGGLVVLAFARRSRAGMGPALAALGVLAATVAGSATLPGFRRHFAVEQQQSALAARYEPGERRLKLEPFEARRLSLRVTNAGATAWRPEDGLSLSCAWYAAGRLSDAGCAEPLPAHLAPGASVVLFSEVRAPGQPGNFYLVWEMFGELGRFSTLGVSPALVPVQVGEPAPGTPSEPPPQLVSQRTRPELWRLAAAMWRERPLFGFGPDNFRKLHTAFAGWPEAGELHAAHNTLLEVAATTGVAGVVTLLAALGTGFAAARRGLARGGAGLAGSTAAIVLGLLAAQLVQSSVDYLLSFTAHYLLFGLVLGASTACERSCGPTSPSAAPRAASAA